MGKSWKIIISGGFSIALFDCRRLPAFYGIKMGNILIDTMNHGKVGAPYFFPGYIISRLRPHCDDMGMETRWFPKEHDLQLIDSYRFYFPCHA